MIICSNCGATNNETSGSICRKCGALLPVGSRPPRIRISAKKKEKEKEPPKPTPRKEKPKPEPKTKPVVSQLQQIPLEEVIEEPQEEEEENQEESLEEDLDILQEIKPQPFKGSIIASKGVYGKNTPQPAVLETQTVKVEATVLRQKQLEEDMTKVLKFLSKKVSVEPLEPKKSTVDKKPIEDKIPPSSMNEILNGLLKLDLHIEASAIINKDGTILASAISSRISDALFGTIGQNLSMIGNDIIQGLSAGTLLNISIRGTNGVLDLAPINTKGDKSGSDMVLIILSHPKVKSGIIHFASNIVRKQVKEYLGLSK